MTTATAPAFANRIGYTDVDPFEVIRVVSDKIIEVREMDAKLAPDWKPEFAPGGFAGHCYNQSSQRWVIASNPANPVIRLHRRKDGNYYKGGTKYRLSDKPRKFYDYNF